MGIATLGNFRFRIDPSAVSWDFEIKATSIKTVGGKVVQVIGTDLGEMIVTGSFGKGGVVEQRAFLARMAGLSQVSIEQYRTRNVRVNPLRFYYPSKKWDFLVYLTSARQAGAPTTVAATPDNHAPGWELRLFIVQDNSDIKKVAQDAYIARLANGLGWKISKYNGPFSTGEIDRANLGEVGTAVINQAANGGN